FEYLRIGRPILCIGPTDGDAAEIIRETGAGSVVDYEDVEGCERVIVRYYELWKAGRLSPSPNRREVEKYSRRNLTKGLARVFDKAKYRL
ncbi:glycosyl transferase family 1, partial [Candidatus Bathyarchaeota archaeon]|nr:glycosyl transferase family 1 [Candidatus Bathyarchaeota archaeon]